MDDNRFFPLLISLIGLLLCAPFFMATPQRALFFNILATTILISAIYGISRVDRSHKPVFITGVLSVLMHTLNTTYHYDSAFFMTADEITSVLFLFSIVYLVFVALFETHRISFGSIYAAICIYLIFGLLFGIIYSATEFLIPGSFHYIYNQPGNNILLLRFQLISFSFSTLTTVGYNQVVAIKPFAQSLVILEEILGVFYLAVLVERLVTGISIMYKERL